MIDWISYNASTEVLAMTPFLLVSMIAQAAVGAVVAVAVLWILGRGLAWAVRLLGGAIGGARVGLNVYPQFGGGTRVVEHRQARIRR